MHSEPWYFHPHVICRGRNLIMKNIHLNVLLNVTCRARKLIVVFHYFNKLLLLEYSQNFHKAVL